MPKCKTCKAEIVWGVTATGSRVPLDPPMKRFVADVAHIPDGDLHVRMVTTWGSHFATCPDADQHRKKDASVEP